MPAIVSRTQEMTTVFLWASTQRVSDDTRFPPVEVVWCFYDVREDAIWTSRPAPSIRNDPYLALNSSLLCDGLTLGCVTSLRTAALSQYDRSFFCIVRTTVRTNYRRDDHEQPNRHAAVRDPA